MQKTRNIARIHEEILVYFLKIRKFNSDLFFDLRTSNRKGRLDKGFWFFGDENFLAVSFWKGKDRGTRRPKISFTVVHNGKHYLDFSQRDTDGKIYNPAFMESIGAVLSPNGDSYQKRYSNFGRNYKIALQTFLDFDKRRIDAAITSDEIYLDHKDQNIESIGFLNPEIFTEALSNIWEYRKGIISRTKSTGYLRKIVIENFKPIQKISVSIPDGCRWVFVTGENGAGKTTFLRALAIGLCNNNDNGHRMYEGIWDFTIITTIDGPQRFEKHVVKPKEPIDGKKILPRGFAAYGPVRLFTRGNLDSDLFNVDTVKIQQRSTYGLFHLIDVLRDLSEPLKLVERPKFYQIAVDNFMDNLREILGIFHISIDEDEESIKLNYFLDSPRNNKSGIVKGLSFNELPSGIRNYSAIICDLLIRFREMQPDVYDPAQYNGIVLIDEIDLHLHPKMQKEIIEQLSATFPRIQFIVSTHSPIPILGAPKNSIFLNVSRDPEHGVIVEQVDIKITNLLPNAILSSPIFDFNEMISVEHDAKERLVTEDDYSEAVFYKILEKKIRENSLRRKEQ